MRNLLIALTGMTLLSGCIISHQDDDPDARSGYPGDIEFRWDFAGQSCATANPQVAKVQVRISGRFGAESLAGGGFYACQTGGVDGIRLTNFEGGPYNFTLNALDELDRAVYTTSGTVFVDGTQVVRATLNRTENIGYLNVYWNFGSAGKKCAAAGIYVPDGQATAPGVTKIVARLDQEDGTTLPCSLVVDGQPVEGLARDLSPGTHLLTLEGYIPDPETGADQLWYKATRTLIVQPGNNQDLTITLDPVATVATIRPVLKTAGGATADCATAGPDPVTKLAIQLTDWANRPYYTTAFEGACSTWLDTGFKFTWLPVEFANPAWDDTFQCYTGTYTVRIEGRYYPNSQYVVVNEGVAQKKFYGGPADQSVTVEMPPKN